MIYDKELLAYKDKINSLEDFKKLAGKNNLNYSEKELTEGYEYFLELCKNAELSSLELENISGGHYDTGNVGPTEGKCYKCHTRISIPSGSYTYCPNCKTKNNEKNCYHGPC